MKTNKEKFTALVSTEKTNTVEKNRARIKNRERIRESQHIALMVLSRLDEWGWSQRRLAEEMQVSPQQITKIVKGKENLTLETIVKLQSILNIGILTSFNNQNNEEAPASLKFEEVIAYLCTKEEVAENPSTSLHKQVVLKYDTITSSYSHEALIA